MNIGRIKDYDITNGDGVRMSLFVTGCEHYCKDCFNSEIWDFNTGSKFTSATMQRIIDVMKEDYIDGISVLGGEPMHPKNITCVLDIIGTIKVLFPKKTVWLWSGYTFEQLNKMYGIHVFDNIDVLVDGKYDRNKRDLKLKYKGSANQRVIDIKKTLSENKIIIWKED